MAISFDATLGTVTNNVTLTTSAACASNGFVVMFVWWFGTQTLNDTFSTGGLSWTQDTENRGTIAGDQNIAIVSAQAPSGLASSTNLTPAFSATPSFGPGIAAFSFTGIETSSPVDATSTFKEDFEEVWSTNNLTTTTADTALVALSAVDTTATTHTPATNYTSAFTAFTAEGGQRMAGVYRIVSSAATYTPGGTWANTVNFQHNRGVAYKAVSGPPPDSPDVWVTRAATVVR